MILSREMVDYDPIMRDKHTFDNPVFDESIFNEITEINIIKAQTISPQLLKMLTKRQK